MYIQVCQLEIHDFLFYASREMGRLYETQAYLHNYALTYALGLARSSYASYGQEPQYAEELEPVNERAIYVTPAHPLHYSFAFHTFKMANVAYHQQSEKANTNKILYGRAKEVTPESRFQFYVLSATKVFLPRWIRLGKWMAKARVDVVVQGVAQERKGRYRSSSVLNPLDLALVPESCNILSMAPASLLTHVSAHGSYYELPLEGKTTNSICVPMEMRYLREVKA